jgi:CDGSH-type Zn-finger protein
MADPEEVREKSPEKKVKVCHKGPYRVTGGVPLSLERITPDSDGYARSWKVETHYPVEDEYLLCRCGRSSTKPFCDRIHEKVGFFGTETASREPYLSQSEVTDGPGLRLTDALILCASARFCDRAGGIWSLTARSGDAGARETAIEEAANCPSGRLVVWEKATGKAIEPELPPSIAAVGYPQEDLLGPLWVRGGIPVESAEGMLYEVRNRVTLCRCGHSFNRPFCDSSHLRWSGNRPIRPPGPKRE